MHLSPVWLPAPIAKTLLEWQGSRRRCRPRHVCPFFRGRPRSLSSSARFIFVAERVGFRLPKPCGPSAKRCIVTHLRESRTDLSCLSHSSANVFLSTHTTAPSLFLKVSNQTPSPRSEPPVGFYIARVARSTPFPGSVSLPDSFWTSRIGGSQSTA